MHFPKTTLAAGLMLGLALGACNKSGQAAQSGADSSTAAAQASAASAEASASSAAASSAEAVAATPSAGTVANAKGENDKSGKPSVSVQEDVQSRGDEAPQDLRAKVDAAKKAGRDAAEPPAK